jgi:hypothetical protein
VDADAICRLDAQARAGFTYLADPVGDDRWRSHADEALAGRPWSGDCDDLASTALDLLFRAGASLSNLYRLEVDAGSGRIDHMIACTWDDAGLAWIVGDTFKAAYPAGQCPHRPVQYQSLDATAVTHQGAPWA